MHDLTDVLDTGGSPALKDDPLELFEDESLKTPSPHSNAGKTYRPTTV